jgi:putative methyltransferase (TIGR04325 family)
LSESETPNIFNGVYNSFEEAVIQLRGAGFSSVDWLERERNRFLTYRELCSLKVTPPPRVCNLPFLVALSGAKSIADFGGSTGWAWEYLRSSGTARTIEKYFVIELEASCGYFASLHTRPVEYLTSLPPDEHIDILYTNSMIQYIADDESFFAILRNQRPTYLLIDDFLGGPISDFFSIQTYYDNQLVVKFRNAQSFVQRVTSLGFELLVSTPTVNPIVGRIQSFPMENFPTDNQIEYPISLLFQSSKIQE